MSGRQARSDDDNGRTSPGRYSDDFDSEDGKRTHTSSRVASPKKVSNHQYYQDKFRGRGRGSGGMRGRSQGRGPKRGRGNSRTSEPANLRKSHDNVASRVISASRNRINELRNKVEELNIQIRDLHQENKLYKKMQFRQEKAIRVFEDKENDLPGILDRHNNEVRALREQNRRLKEKYDKIDHYLRDAEDELERVKKKMKKYKEMCDENELQERGELSRQLAQGQSDMEEKETKLKELQRYIEMLKKNHRHELGIEVARQKDVKKQLEDLTGKNSQLESQLKEKEKALEYLNIYSNPHQGRTSRDNSPESSLIAKSKKKASTASELTPREKAKFYAEKRRAELFKQKELKEEKERQKREQWEKEERAKDKITSSNGPSEFVFGGNEKEKEGRERLEEEKRQRRDIDNREKREEEIQRRQREFDSIQQQDDVDRKVRESRERKEHEKKEKDEWEMRERKRGEDKERREQDEKKEQEEREKKKKLEEKVRQEDERREREDRERMERDRKEEQEKREREIIEQERKLQREREKIDNDPHLLAERKKKDDLLKKLQAVDERGGASSDPFSPSSPLKKNKEQSYTSGIRDEFDSQSRRSEPREYSFTKPINNLHQGKPSHEDVTVSYLERQKRKRQTSDDPGGYQPSFGPARGDMNKAAAVKPPSIFDDEDDESFFKVTNHTLTKQYDKKSTNLLENLFGPEANTKKNKPIKTMEEKGASFPKNTTSFSNNQTKTKSTTNTTDTPPWDIRSGSTHKSRSDPDKRSTIFGESLIEDDLPGSAVKVLPRRHRQQNLSTFSSKPSVTAVDNFDDEVEELML